MLSDTEKKHRDNNSIPSEMLDQISRTYKEILENS